MMLGEGRAREKGKAVLLEVFERQQVEGGPNSEMEVGLF